MKTQALNWHSNKFTEWRKLALDFPDTGSGLQAMLFLLSGAVPFALLSIITIWTIAAGGAAYVSATAWAAGFMFLAMAMDNDNGRGLSLVGSGIALMALAWLNSRVSVEFGMLAGFLLAGWLAVTVMKCFALRTCGATNTPRA